MAESGTGSRIPVQTRITLIRLTLLLPAAALVWGFFLPASSSPEPQPGWLMAAGAFARLAGFFAIAILAYRSGQRLKAIDADTEPSPLTSWDWLIRLATWVLAGLCLALGRASDALALFGVGLGIGAAVASALGPERGMASGSPFASLRRDSVSEDDDAPPPHSTVELAIGLLTAMLFIVLSYTYMIEAFRIPTGSMEPTLFGHPTLGDRALVDKQTYQFTDPKRGDVTVFRFPQQRSQPYVKRTVGLPGEAVAIVNGDIWIQDQPGDMPRLWQKSGRIRETAWLPLFSFSGGESAFRSAFLGETGKATPSERGFTLEPTGEQPGKIRYPRTGSIRNSNPLDQPARSGEIPYDREAVGDLRINLRAEPAAGALLMVTLHRDHLKQPVRFILTGPDLEQEKLVEFLTPYIGDQAPVILANGIAAGRTTHLMVADGCVGHWFDGLHQAEWKTLSGLEESVAALVERRKTSGKPLDISQSDDLDALHRALGPLKSCHVELSAHFGPVVVSQFEIERDFHYLGRMVFSAKEHQEIGRVWMVEPAATLPMGFRLGDDEYLMLGDHTEDSLDSRMWFVVALELANDSVIELPMGQLLSMPDAIQRHAGARWQGRISNSLLGIPGADTPERVGQLLFDEIRRGEFGQELLFLDIHGIPRAVAFQDVKSVRVFHAPGVPRGLIDGRLLGSLFPRPRFVD